MNETALYYTLSTVSQTLAGALGMLAAFLALRVSALDRAFWDDMSYLEEHYPGIIAGRPLTANMATTLEVWQQKFDQASSESSRVRRAEHHLRLRSAVLPRTMRAFGSSAFVMGACFVGLATTPWLSCSYPRAWTAAGAAIVSGIACLVWYGRIVRQALD